MPTRKRSIEQQQDLVAKVDVLRAAGSTLLAACKANGIKSSNYSGWKHRKPETSPALQITTEETQACFDLIQEKITTQEWKALVKQLQTGSKPYTKLDDFKGLSTPHPPCEELCDDYSEARIKRQ